MKMKKNRLLSQKWIVMVNSTKVMSSLHQGLIRKHAATSTVHARRHLQKRTHQLHPLLMEKFSKKKTCLLLLVERS